MTPKHLNRCVELLRLWIKRPLMPDESSFLIGQGHSLCEVMEVLFLAKTWDSANERHQSIRQELIGESNGNH